MRFTEEMLAEDEKRWHARDVVTELGYCGNYIQDRKNMTNLDIRFYAFLMRKAHDMLKKQEPKHPLVTENAYGWKFYHCPSCGREFYGDRLHGRMNKMTFCDKCGQAVKWDG